MPWRKWFVRGLVFSIIGACVGVALVYQHWTDPAVVRELVIANLQEMYPGAVITVDSARLRFFGGIQVNELRMSRRDDPDRTEFFHVPSAVIYHDKEKISQGLLTLRKIELHHPRLRIVKQRDGTWNVQGIVRARPADQPVPTLVVRHGTIVLEDQRSILPAAALEMTDLSLSFINDPLNILTMTGSAKSVELGSLQLKGTIRRDTKEISLKVKTNGTMLGPALMDYFTSGCPNVADLAIEAKVDVEANLLIRPEQKELLDYHVKLNMSEGKLRHPRLPLPLEDIRATLECSNGTVRIDNFHARCKQTVLKGWASAQLPCPAESFQTELEVQHLMMDDELAAHLPQKVYHLQKLFQAKGPTSIRIACSCRDGEWVNLPSGAPSCFTLLPEGGEACFKFFPYPLKQVKGSIEWVPATTSIAVNVIAFAQQRPVQIVGCWQGQDDEVSASFEISARDVTIDDPLVAALPEKLEKLTRSFHPTGQIDVHGHLLRQPGSSDFRHEYHLCIRDGRVCWDEFPYPLERVSGFLDIFPDEWNFHDGRGWHGGGEVQIEGNSVPAQYRAAAGGKKRSCFGDDGMELTLRGRAVAMDHDLHKALGPMPQLAKAWESMRPQGKLNFAACVYLPPGRPQDVDVRVNVKDAAIYPQFFPYLLGNIDGQFRFHKNRLEAKGIKARHNDTQVKMDQGSVDILPGGGHYTKLDKLHIEQLRTDDALLQALPKTLRSFIGSLQLNRPVDIDTELVIFQDGKPGSEPDVWWDGQLAVRDAQFTTGVTLDKVDGGIACRGRLDGRTLKGLRGNLLFDQATVFKQNFQRVQGNFWVDERFPDVLHIGVHAPIFGGDVTGQARVELTSYLRYDIDLSASHINLQQFGAHNLGPRSELDGFLEGRLCLQGSGSSAETLDGNGRVDVNHGRLYNLPLLLDLLKFLGLRWPDRTAFEDLHADFSVHGSRARVRSLKLTGNAISLIGKGEFNLDGTDLNLDFFPISRYVDQFSWLKPFSPFTSFIGKNILVIEMRGKVDSNPDDLKFNKRFVPLIADQFRDLRQVLESR